MSDLIQYVLVTETGGVYDCNFRGNLAAAKAVAKDATAKNDEGRTLTVAKLVTLSEEEEAYEENAESPAYAGAERKLGQPIMLRPTERELWARVAELEARAGKTTDELREARKTWDMTVDQRDCLDELESTRWLLGEDHYQED